MDKHQHPTGSTSSYQTVSPILTGIPSGFSSSMNVYSASLEEMSLSSHQQQGYLSRLLAHNATNLVKHTFPKDKINFLLLEAVSTSAVDMITGDGFHVETVTGALSEEELMEKIENVHVLGIRSKTRVTKRVLERAKRLLAIGCFCIGTDQVDLHEAEIRGIAVFNAPFSNTRSVAELVVAEVIALHRNLGDRSSEMHKGIWNKSAVGCFEVRGKTLGIVGYGHIGSQVSILAEMMGMRVIFYDIVPKLPLGNATRKQELNDVLKEADVVSLHVPRADSTLNMIQKEQLNMMKKGSYLINAARGTVVKLEDLQVALKSGHLAGCAVDVFPEEPEKNGPGFVSVLQGCPNTILTPHVAGSTKEAQSKIGEEVAASLIGYINTGSTMSSVNLPNLDIPITPGGHRILNVHRNVPGVLRDITNIFANLGVNVRAQVLGTTADIGYLIIDVDKETSVETKNAIADLSTSIKTRLLY